MKKPQFNNYDEVLKFALEFGKLVQLLADHPFVTASYRLRDPKGNLIGEFNNYVDIYENSIDKDGNHFKVELEHIEQVFVITCLKKDMIINQC